MKLSQSLLATTLCLVSAACIGCNGDMDASLPSAPSLKTLDGPSGSGSVNSLLNTSLHDHKLQLLRATRSKARWSFKSNTVSSGIVATGLLDTPEGRDVFKYAVRCAVPEGTTLTYQGQTYPGGGLLSTTVGWLDAPMTTAQKEDLFTCMIVHVNPTGHEVSFFLFGPSVQGTESYEYWRFINLSDNLRVADEAHWAASIIGDDDDIQFHAWPAPTPANCDEPPLGFVLRACDGALETCGVVEETSGLELDGDNYAWWNGKPAILTRLVYGIGEDSPNPTCY